LGVADIVVLSVATRSTWIEGLLLMGPGLTAARAEVGLETIPTKPVPQRRDITNKIQIMVITWV
jgi:hypothetical protein